MARALAEFLFDDEQAIVRIDMSEYMEQHSVARLIGSPPGYVGYDEGGQLTESIRRKPYSVILFDEIEKAHPEVFNILLQILDEGRLTDNKGRTVNFKNSIIIMTSNMGAPLIMEKSQNITEENKADIHESIKEEVLTILRKNFRPEFINRIDDIIVFHSLSHEEISKIVHLQLNLIIEKLSTQGIQIKIKDNVVKYLANKGYIPEFGARPIKRLIHKEIVNELAKYIIAGTFVKEDSIIVDIKNDKIDFKKNKL